MKNALKKELREKAKNHQITKGVLSVRNTVTGRQYIQGALNLEALVNKIKFLLNSGQFSNIQLQKDWTEQGTDSFSFEFAVVIPSQENQYINERKEIQKAEQAHISGINTELY